MEELKLCVCCLNKSNLSSTNELLEGITYYEKIKQHIPQILSDKYDLQKGLLCTNCKSSINYTYRFIVNCMKNKIVLEDLICNVKKEEDIVVSDEEIKFDEADIDDKDNPELSHAKQECNESLEDVEQTVIEFVDVGHSLGEPDKNTDLNKVESVNNVSKDVLLDDTNQTKHSCPKCGKVFLQVWNLKSHLKYAHTDENKTPEEVTQPKIIKIESEEILSGSDDTSRKYKCTKCMRAFFRIWHLNTHMKYKHNTKRDYKCMICSKEFVEVSNFRKHLHNHKDAYKYECEKCQFRFLTESELTDHKNQLRCYLKEKIKCKYCNSFFHRESALLRHMNDRHIKEKRFVCELCGRGFLRNYSLQLHMKNIHGGKEFSCEICNKQFASNGILKKHIKIHFDENNRAKSDSDTQETTKKDDSPKSQCDLCGKLYLGNLDKHLRTHTNVRPYQCTFCSYKSYDKAQRSQHIRRVHYNEKNHICHICGKAFFCRTVLEKHIKQHTNTEIYSCTICEKTFKDKNNLRRHNNLLHKGDSEKKFECNLCGRKVWSNADLIRHMRIHTGEKPFGCEVCGKKFAVKRQVTVHYNFVHAKQRPYLCTICNKRYATQNCLNVHMKTHSLPFKCELCSKAFKYKNHIQRHLNKGACKKYSKAAEDITKHIDNSQTASNPT